MSKYNDIINAIYDSDEFRIKGRKLVIEDCFICGIDNIPYVIFIVRNSPLDNSSEAFLYVFYSLADEAVISYKKAEYEYLASHLPSLDSVNSLGSVFDFEKQIRLPNEIHGLIDIYADKMQFTAEESQMYRQKLIELKAIKSPSLQSVYNYFINKERK